MSAALRSFSIVPAILPGTRADLEDKLAQLAAIGTITDIQIDAVDGRFAAPACWPYSMPAVLAPLMRSPQLLPHAGRFAIDADLMVSNAEEAVALWSALGATRLTIHAESAHSLPRTIAAIKARYGHDTGFAPGLFSLGVALNIGTDLSLIAPHLGEIDYVQLMGIADIGKQSQPFDRRVLGKVRELRALDREIVIQIDGGVTLETAPELLSAGANRLVVGHALWQARDLTSEFAKFNAL